MLQISGFAKWVHEERHDFTKLKLKDRLSFSHDLKQFLHAKQVVKGEFQCKYNV